VAFTIAITGELRAIIAELVSRWQCSDIVIPASSDLIVERVARAATTARVHGASSCLVPAAAGSYFAGLPFRIALQPQAAERLAYIADALGDPASALAAVLVVRQFAQALARESFFYQRYVEALRRQWPQLHAKALAALAADDLKLNGFLIAGVAELLNLLPPDFGVITHAGLWRPDHVREAQLASVFDWDAVSFDPLAAAPARERTIAGIIDREHWILVTNEPREDLADVLRAQVQASLRGVTHYVYAPDGPQRLVSPHQQLALLPSAQFNDLRSQYLNAAIRPGGAKASLAGQYVAVLVGGVIIGAYALSFDPQLCTIADGQVEPPSVYLLSDFAVGPTDEPRLSKLVVMAALSREAQLLAERRLAQRWRSVVTTAFAKHPVSMKYRGLLNLIGRAQVESADFEGGTGYKLTYGGPLGRHTLAESLALWTLHHQRH